MSQYERLSAQGHEVILSRIPWLSGCNKCNAWNGWRLQDIAQYYNSVLRSYPLPWQASARGSRSECTVAQFKGERARAQARGRWSHLRTLRWWMQKLSGPPAGRISLRHQTYLRRSRPSSVPSVPQWSLTPSVRSSLRRASSTTNSMRSTIRLMDLLRCECSAEASEGQTQPPEQAEDL